MMARRPADYGQHVTVINGTVPKRVAARIEQVIDGYVRDPKVAAATVVLPKIVDIGVLVKVTLQLATLPRWVVTNSTIPATAVGDVVAFAVTREVPRSADGRDVPSEALVLGDFAVFPNTRRAPVTALEMFVGDPDPLDPKSRTPTGRANLAHVEARSKFPNDRSYNKTWDNTVAGRLRSLGGVNDLRAKAKVSFVVPLALATSLGVVATAPSGASQ